MGKISGISASHLLLHLITVTFSIYIISSIAAETGKLFSFKEEGVTDGLGCRNGE